MLEIETNRLLITPYTKEYLEDLFMYRSDPDVAKYYSIQPKDKFELDEYIQELNTDFYDENSYTLFVIKMKKDYSIIGDIAVKNWRKKGIISAIGFAINPLYQNNGYGKEAVKGFCDYLIMKENRVRIQADVDSRNLKSMRILEYAGMKNEEEFHKIDENNGEEFVEFMYGINVEKIDLTIAST